MLRVPIEEIGVGETIIRAPKASETKQKIEAEDRVKFEQTFMKSSPQAQLDRTSDMEDATSSNLRNKITEITSQVTGVNLNGNTEENENSLKLNISEITGDEQDVKPARNKKKPATSASTTSPQTSPRVPPVPSSSFQFQADFKVLKNTSEQFYQYLKVSILPF